MQRCLLQPAAAAAARALHYLTYMLLQQSDSLKELHRGQELQLLQALAARVDAKRRQRPVKVAVQHCQRRGARGVDRLCTFARGLRAAPMAGLVSVSEMMSNWPRGSLVRCGGADCRLDRPSLYACNTQPPHQLVPAPPATQPKGPLPLNERTWAVTRPPSPLYRTPGRPSTSKGRRALKRAASSGSIVKGLSQSSAYWRGSIDGVGGMPGGWGERGDRGARAGRVG